MFTAFIDICFPYIPTLRIVGKQKFLSLKFLPFPSKFENTQSHCANKEKMETRSIIIIYWILVRWNGFTDINMVWKRVETDLSSECNHLFQILFNIGSKNHLKFSRNCQSFCSTTKQKKKIEILKDNVPIKKASTRIKLQIHVT